MSEAVQMMGGARQRVRRSKEARAVGDVLTAFVERGVLRGFSEGQLRIGKMNFDLLWHHEREFRLGLDLEAGTLTFPCLLPGVRAQSPLFRDLKAFLRPVQTGVAPESRRIDPSKAQLDVKVHRRGLSLGVVVTNGEYEYCARQLICLAQEILRVFLLRDEPCCGYRAEKLEVGADAWA